MMSYQRRRRRLALFRAMCVVLSLLIALVVMDINIRPMIKTMAAYEAKNYAVRAINAAVSQELTAQGVTYDGLCRVSVNEQGVVTAVETDVVRLGLLQAGITQRVSEAMDELSQHDVSVPMGTLLGSQYLSGRGPQVGFRIIPIGYAEASLRNEFVSAGINQTCHRILLDVSVNVTALIPGYSAATQVRTEICLAETVIVGVVPDSFTNVTGDGRDTLTKLYDYGADK